jgi:hypothetical protein
MSPKARLRPKDIALAYYHLQITGWDCDYSFSVNVPRWEEKHYADYRHLVVQGTLLLPRKIKVEAAELNFIPEVVEMDRRYGDEPPRGVGTLNIHDERLIGYLAMPLDALGHVLQMLIAERYRYVLLDGESMRYRKAFIRRYEFTARYNADEYPAD